MRMIKNSLLAGLFGGAMITSGVAFSIDLNFWVTNKSDYEVTVENDGVGLSTRADIEYNYCKTTVKKQEPLSSWSRFEPKEIIVKPSKDQKIPFGTIQYPWACPQPFTTSLKFKVSRKIPNQSAEHVYQCDLKLKLYSKFLGDMQISSIEKTATSGCEIDVIPNGKYNDVNIILPAVFIKATETKKLPPSTCLSYLKVGLYEQDTIKPVVCQGGTVVYELPEDDSLSSMEIEFRKPVYRSGTKAAFDISAPGVIFFQAPKIHSCEYSPNVCSVLIFPVDSPRNKSNVMYTGKSATLTVKNQGDGELQPYLKLPN